MISSGSGGDRVRRLHDGMDPTAPLRVPEADDHDVGDVGMLAQGRLDLGREDVHRAGDDHVGPSVGHVEIALVVVDPAQIPHGHEPVVGAGHLRDVVAHVGRGRSGRGPHVDGAHLAGGQLPVVGVEDPDLRVSEPAPQGAGMLEPLVTPADDQSGTCRRKANRRR
jgi:hypothetical protein